MPKTTPLFCTTWWLLRAGMALSTLTAVAMALGLFAVVPVVRSRAQDIPAIVDGLPQGQFMAFAAFVLVTGAASFALIAAMFAAIAALVRSAMGGDPFVAQNAARLRRVGWLLLAVQAIGVVTMVIYELVPKALRDVYLDFGPSPAGLLAILVIFVLARIFREGADMRADLEGTV